MLGQGEQPGEGARTELGDNGPPGVPVVPFEIIETGKAGIRRTAEIAQYRQPLRLVRSRPDPQRAGTTSQAGEGACGKTQVSQSERQPEPGCDTGIGAGELAHALDHTDEGRMLGRFRWLADRRRQGVTPGEPVLIPQALVPGGEGIERIEMGGATGPAGYWKAAAPRKYINFIDLESLHLEGARVPAPGGPCCPC